MFVWVGLITKSDFLRGGLLEKGASRGGGGWGANRAFAGGIYSCYEKGCPTEA